MKTALVTGSNRGIGLELVKQLLARGERVIAACRTPSDELAALAAETANLVIVDNIDVAAAASAKTLAEKVDGETIDTLILNAGIFLHGDRAADPDFDGIQTQLEVNAIGALRSAVALLPRLAPHAKVAFVSSRMGSIGDNGSGNYYGYRMSKAALNMGAVSLAKDVASRGIAVTVLHPGMVKTDMTRGQGNVDADVAVRGLLARIDELTVKTSGGFWHANGEQLPW